MKKSRSQRAGVLIGWLVFVINPGSFQTALYSPSLILSLSLPACLLESTGQPKPCPLCAMGFPTAGRKTVCLSLSVTICHQLTRCRGLPCLQILAVSKPWHAVPDQPRMLPQDVRVVRGPDFLVWALELPRRRMQQDTPQEPIPDTDIRGHQCGKGGRYTTQGYAGVSTVLLSAVHCTRSNGLASIAGRMSSRRSARTTTSSSSGRRSS